jgi:Ca2+-binding RTX toxin-like protein
LLEPFQTFSVFPNILLGESGNDSLEGMGGNDTLYGGEGNDDLDGGAGTDILIGGTGNDTYTVQDSSDAVFEGANGGTDQIDASINFSLIGLPNVENLTLIGNAISGTGNNLNNRINGNNLNNTLTGGLGDDTLNGRSGNDVLNGDAGNDTLEGGSGIDNLSGGIGNDTLDGGANNDNLVGGAGNDTLRGQSGVDVLNGGTGNDSLLGGTGGDRLVGGSGDDVLNGEAGNDTLTGGSGRDTFTFTGSLAGLGRDLIVDFNRGQGDKIQLSPATFTGLNDINAQFGSFANDIQAIASSALIAYSRGSRTLFYNPDLGGGGGTAFASVPGQLLRADDFIVA